MISSDLPFTFNIPEVKLPKSELSNQPSSLNGFMTPSSDKYPLAIMGPVNLTPPKSVILISTPSRGFWL